MAKGPAPVSSVPSDPFVARFFGRIPAAVRPTFTDAQLDAVKLAFGGRGWGRHAVDMRRSIPTPFGRYYMVLLIGRERRQDGQGFADTALGRAAIVALVLVFLLVMLICAFVVLYTLKMAFHIDIVPGLDMLPDGLLQKWLS